MYASVITYYKIGICKTLNLKNEVGIAIKVSLTAQTISYTTIIQQ